MYMDRESIKIIREVIGQYHHALKYSTDFQIVKREIFL